MTPKISVAIPTMGRETLMHTLRSLERQTISPHEVLVVNQGPPDVEERAKFDLPLKWLHQDAKGLSRARNRALTSFEGDFILFTDDDQEVNAEWVEQLGVLTTAYSEIDLFGGTVFPPPRYNPAEEFVSQLYVIGEQRVNRATYLQPTGTEFILNDIWGGNFALSQRCVEKIGLYDEQFGRGSGLFDVGEDTDYLMRCMSAGLEGLLSCRLIIYHTYGGRPHSQEMTSDNIEVAAALAWKSQQPNAPIDPEIAARIVPFGQKKAILGKLSGGKLFGDQAERKAVYQATIDKLNAGWSLREGCLVPK